MVAMRNETESEEFNILSSKADWAWPEAISSIFRPRGVNLLLVGKTDDFLNVIRHRRIHATILDMDYQEVASLTMLRIIRMNFPAMPCILLSSKTPELLLGKALQLEVFSVINKPVDMAILLAQLNRLFIKRYNSHIFAD